MIERDPEYYEGYTDYECDQNSNPYPYKGSKWYRWREGYQAAKNELSWPKIYSCEIGA